MEKLIIAYCIENQYVAAKMATALKGKMEIEKAVFEDGNGIEVLKKAANGNAFPVLLLISDNFLKSEYCMNNALPFIQSLGSSKRLIPVTTEGVYKNAETGKVTTVPTSFDRVSNVIQFMNYWQDRYLELRKLKDEGDESAHSDKVRMVRAISSEIGELLRYFRTMEFYSFDQFKESNFIILHRVLGLEFTKQAEEASHVTISHTVLPNEEVAYSNGIKTPTISYEEQQPPIELSDIPGIALLNERLNVRDSTIGTAFDAVVGKKDKQSPKVEEIIQPQPENKVVEEKPIEEKPLAAQNDLPFTLEALVQDIRAEVKETVVESTAPLKKDEIVEENHAESLENIEKPTASHIAGLTLEQLVKDEDSKKIMEKQTPLEKIEGILKNADETTKLTNDTHLDNSIDDEDDKLVKQIAAEAESENQVEMPLAAASLDAFIEKTDAELSSEIVDEEDVQNEVARLFDEAEQMDTNFDFESQLTQVVDSQQDVVENTLHTEGGDSTKTALETMQKAVLNDPSNNTLRYQYASELTNQNRFTEATEQLDVLLDNDRTNVDAYILLAYLAEQQGDFILSLNSLEKVTLLKPNYPGIYYKLGRLTNGHFKKQHRKALRYFRDAIAQDEANADAQYHYAVAMIEHKGDFKTAIDHLHIAVEQAPQRDDVAFELAKAYFEINNKADAAKWYARATELNSQHKTDSNDQLFYYVEPKPEPEPILDNGITVLVTGATSGIGKATAAIFAQNGYRLILTGRRADRLETLKTDFETEYNNRIQVLNFDVRSLEEMKKSLSKLEEDFKNVDILINNAGLASGFAPIHEGDVEDWDRMIDTNIKGLLYMTRAIAPQMVARRKGHIVNIGSIAGKEIYPNGNVYSASKFAVDALTRAMRVDLHKYNIRVSQVSPGAVEETEFAMVRFNGDAEKANIYKDFTPLKASDVAETIYFMVTRPEYVNIQDVVMMGTQQGSANHFDRSGRTDVSNDK